jgi:hypothetical protein
MRVGCGPRILGSKKPWRKMHAVGGARRSHTLPMHSAHSLGCTGVGHLQSALAQLIWRSRQTCAFLTFECAAAVAIDHGPGCAGGAVTACVQYVTPTLSLFVRTNLTIFCISPCHSLSCARRLKGRPANNRRPTNNGSAVHARLAGVFSWQGHVQYMRLWVSWECPLCLASCCLLIVRTPFVLSF